MFYTNMNYIYNLCFSAYIWSAILFQDNIYFVENCAEQDKKGSNVDTRNSQDDSLRGRSKKHIDEKLPHGNNWTWYWAQYNQKVDIDNLSKILYEFNLSSFG